jgi:DNA invertase Pin-like site-specific DNA recombinase
MNTIAYYRVSTREQGNSGLGLEAQQATVAAYCKANGSTIVARFTEVESGKIANRPQLQAAIAACKQHGARLIVAKLDRLSRNVAFTAALMDSGVDFVCCDNPSANKLTIHVLAAVAQAEAEAISQRTRAALGALKARGVKLGSPKASQDAPGAGRANVAKAAAYAATIQPLAAKKRASGKTLQEIADFLNGRGMRTRRGGFWGPVAVMRLLA